ncbi:MAG: MtaA/CmuA family methyltransferase [Oscillospiraceae bacterium]
MSKEITQKSRLLKAIKKQEVDRQPCICPGGMMNMMFYEIMDKCQCFWPETHNNPEKMAKLAMALNEDGGFENYGVPFCMTVEAESMGATVNMGNEYCEPHIINGVLNSSKELLALKPIDITKGRVKTVIDAIKILKSKGTEVPIVGNLTGPISLGGTLIDMAILLREMRKSPEEVIQYLDLICDNLINYAKAQIEAGADVICISEPSGTGEIMGPKNFSKFTVTCLNKIMDSLDVPVKIIHICGNLASVYDILPQLHCDAFSFDAIVPVNEIKKHLTTQCVMGNISTFALGTMPAEKIATLVGVALKGGVDIVSPACGLPTQTPLKNVQAMVKAVRESK